MAREHQVSIVPFTRRLGTFSDLRAFSFIDVLFFCAQGHAVVVEVITSGSATHVEHFNQAAHVRAVAIGAPSGGHASRAVAMGPVARAKLE